MRKIFSILMIIFSPCVFAVSEKPEIEKLHKTDKYLQARIGSTVYRFNGVAVSGHEEGNFIEVNGYKLFEGHLERTVEDDGDYKLECELSDTAEALSFVGTIVSMRTNSGSYCEHQAYMNHSLSIRVFKVDKNSSTPVKLNSIFKDAEIENAVLSDKYIKDNYPNIKDHDSLVKSEVYSYVLNNYSFHHLNKEKVSVRIYFPENEHGFGGVVLGIYLTPNPEYKSDFIKANKAGLLQENIGKFLQ